MKAKKPIKSNMAKNNKKSKAENTNEPNVDKTDLIILSPLSPCLFLALFYQSLNAVSYVYFLFLCLDYNNFVTKL
ncbi:Uncharacterised protein [Haemophilus pittmaniae]|uniref:Uncharacterized protein n=1 Tax=Haemophilus pittmaniae TaxID=249188 RepID=A0A377IXA6_9PAST|nr:Uncharacterised protein [Haemophilus pittmaniae]